MYHSQCGGGASGLIVTMEAKDSQKVATTCEVCSEMMSMREHQLAKQTVAISRNSHIHLLARCSKPRSLSGTLSTYALPSFCTLCHTFCCTWPTIPKALAICCVTCWFKGHKVCARHTLRICTPSCMKTTLSFSARTTEIWGIVAENGFKLVEIKKVA